MDAQLCLSLLLFGLGSASAGECCDSYYDLQVGDYHPAQWCDNYCCGNSDLKLYCCDSFLLEAPDSDRLGFCELWWSNHVWAPILVAVGCLAILICCCVCCYRCCCRSTHHTTIIQGAPPGQPGVSVTSVNTVNTTSVNSGYNQPVAFDKINPI